jgi:hypothetical protein
MIDRWLALAPGNHDALELRGRLHAEAQRWAEAWADFAPLDSAVTNRELAMLRTECFRRSFTSGVKLPVVREGEPLTLQASLPASAEISWQWQHEGADIPGAVESELRFPSLARTNFGRYRVRFRHRSGQATMSPTVLMGPLPVGETVKGHWDFDQGTLAATIGHDLEFVDGPQGETEKQTRFGTTTELGLPGIGGRPARVMRFPAASPAMGYLLRHDALANGGGRRVNQYTIIWDLLILDLRAPTNAPKAPTWTSLFQSSVQNLNDTDFCIRWKSGAGQLGINDQYAGEANLQPGRWYRIAAAVDLAAPKPVISKFVDGRKHADQTILADVSFGDEPEGLDGEFSLLPAILLFTDDDGETTAGYVNSIQFHNVKLTDEQIAALGGPSAEGIPLSITAE